MNSSTSERRLFGTSFFRRSDCLKLTRFTFFEERETRATLSPGSFFLAFEVRPGKSALGTRLKQGNW